MHAQGMAAPTADQQQQMVAFESGLFTAQNRDNNAGNLSAAGATGGPNAIANLLPGFFIGINDPVPGGTPPSFGNPMGKPFTSFVFDPYDAWNNIGGPGEQDEYRRSVARGQTVFNTVPINITRVAGINDTFGVGNFPGFCATCHDTPDVGNHSRKLGMNIGVTNGGPNNDNPVLDIAALPVFTLPGASWALTTQAY